MYTELVKSTFIKINSFATKMLKYSPEIITAFWPTKSFLSGTVCHQNVKIFPRDYHSVLANQIFSFRNSNLKKQLVLNSKNNNTLAIQVNLAMR
jgi:hypothetical protein